MNTINRSAIVHDADNPDCRCRDCRQQVDAVSIDGDAGVADRVVPVSFRSQLPACTCDDRPFWPCARHPLTSSHRTTRVLPSSDTEPSPPLDADRIETAARAGTVISLLERCSEELARLELVPSSDADDVNALSAARGFVARARNLLCGRFQ